VSPGSKPTDAIVVCACAEAKLIRPAAINKLNFFINEKVFG
jgi:hypothetical protein